MVVNNPASSAKLYVYNVCKLVIYRFPHLIFIIALNPNINLKICEYNDKQLPEDKHRVNS
jgi:hypothetical protein